MNEFFERAIANVTKFGDTDIFPHPIENYVFFDKVAESIDLLLDIDRNFDDRIAQHPPVHYNALAPISYTGFRWASQLDPLWNLYLLGTVLSISEEIERARVPAEQNIVFSYRYCWNHGTSEIFTPNYNWRKFMEQSEARARESNFVLLCDISEFYPRLNHHRLENALKQLRLPGSQSSKIMKFLAQFTSTQSFGIPVGGPAARILSELLLNQIDRLLVGHRIVFCRFADDFHIFCNTYEEAYRNLVFLSEKLFHNQGLHLQRSKTRIMSSREFLSAGHANVTTSADEARISDQSRAFLQFSLKFDPYSPNAADNYESLKSELRRFDLIGLLKSELAKSQIHIALARKIVSAIRYLDPVERDGAVLSLILNSDTLYPIYANVLVALKTVHSDLDEATQTQVERHILDLIRSDSHLLRADLNLAYAIRVLSMRHTPESEEVLVDIFSRTQSAIIRRDIILVMARWRCWYWLSDVRSSFRTFGPAERRAFLIASFMLTDEGKHWRGYITAELSPFERLVKLWAAERTQQSGWELSL